MANFLGKLSTQIGQNQTVRDISQTVQRLTANIDLSKFVQPDGGTISTSYFRKFIQRTLSRKYKKEKGGSLGWLGWFGALKQMLDSAFNGDILDEMA